MRKPYTPKPATAAWISRERKRLGMSVADLRERLRLMGVEVTEQTMRVWEGNSDRPPGPERLDALERIFGTQAPDRAAPQSDQAALVAALMAQTAAITQLVEELRVARGMAEEVRERVAAIEAYRDEHELRLRADRQLMGLAPVEDSPLRSPQPVAARR